MRTHLASLSQYPEVYIVSVPEKIQAPYVLEQDRNIGNSMPRKMFPIVRVIFEFHEYHTMLYNRDEKETHETKGN